MKTDSVVRDDETVEDLQLAGLQLIQNKKAFRFGMDSVLLADFADVQLNDSVADLGTGNGILPILLWGRKKGEVFHCFEMIPEAAELAKRNASINHIENRMFIYQADVSDSLQYVKPGSIDAVISNPPYGQPSASLKSPNSLKAYAAVRLRECRKELPVSIYILLHTIICYRSKISIFIVKMIEDISLLLFRWSDLLHYKAG